MSLETQRKALIDGIPRAYSPWLHLFGTTSICLAAMILGAVMIRGPVSWYEWLILPVMLVLSNAVEWRAHKDILHHPRPLLQEIYRRHTPEHHSAFTHDRMEVGSYREMKLVLLPVFGIFLIVGAVIPFALLANRLVSPNSGWFVVIASGLYVLSYELFHAAYHLPRESRISQWGWLQRLREHHRLHHDVRLMQSWNFNVTLPLFDWVHGTIYSGARERTADPGSLRQGDGFVRSGQ